MSSNEKSYESDSLKVYWKPEICEHVGECVQGLPNVFNVNHKPWISIENAETKEIMRVIDTCPSKALTYELKNKRI